MRARSARPLLRRAAGGAPDAYGAGSRTRLCAKARRLDLRRAWRRSRDAPPQGTTGRGAGDRRRGRTPSNDERRRPQARSKARGSRRDRRRPRCGQEDRACCGRAAPDRLSLRRAPISSAAKDGGPRSARQPARWPLPAGRQGRGNKRPETLSPQQDPLRLADIVAKRLHRQPADASRGRSSLPARTGSIGRPWTPLSPRSPARPRPGLS